MNIIDSESAQVFGPQPGRNIAAPKTAALKARLAKILAASGIKPAEVKGDTTSHFTFGVEMLDRALRGNASHDGLPCAALHELHAAEKADIASATAMALLLAEKARHDSAQRPILWISESGEARRQGKLYPPGLVEFGIDPGSIIHVDAPNSIAALRAAAEGVRSASMAAVIIELAGKKPKGLDLTATRRLSLCAQKSGVLALLLRSGSNQENPLPTAAYSRWSVSAAPSLSLEANAPGHSAFDINLLRHRSGLYGLSARLEWNREYKAFREQEIGNVAPDIGAIPSVSIIRADHQTTRAA